MASSRSSRFTLLPPGENIPGLDDLEKRNMSSLCHESNHNIQDIQPIA
jgi:hypothetical protein